MADRRPDDGVDGLDGPRDVLVADLVALGRSVPSRPVDDAFVRRVTTDIADIAGIAAAPATRRTAPSRRAPVVVAAVVAVVVGAIAVPPVRAAVAELFGFGGVLVREEPGPAPSTAPPPPGAASDLTLAEAADLVPFRPAVPKALGDPDGVEVSADRRVLSLTWETDDGTVLLDQIGARLDYAFAKSATGVEFVTVAGDFALWFAEPHEVVVLEPDGTARRETARLAGHTLIWERGQVTMRLEGDLTRAQAVAVAETVAEPVAETGAD